MSAQKWPEIDTENYLKLKSMRSCIIGFGLWDIDMINFSGDVKKMLQLDLVSVIQLMEKCEAVLRLLSQCTSEVVDGHEQVCLC